MTRTLPSISANDLAEVIKAKNTIFDFTAAPAAICRQFERAILKRVTFAALVLAMLKAGYSAVPHGSSFRFTHSGGTQ